ncbi:MAG: transglycosylase SLT domain-containing protein [Alphaproteobacteria bacterium]
MAHRKNIRRRRFALVLAAVAIAAASGGAVAAEDPGLAKAGACARPIVRTEQAEGIPRHLLTAISLAESGRYDDASRETIAWPWTINAEGRGMFFETKEAAVAAVQKLRARGVASIDVGCMQVNLFHHKDAFANLGEAFDPAANVAYAARFLKSLREEKRSWSQAVASYHSAERAFGAPYRSTVYALWAKVRRAAAKAKQQEVIEAYLKRRAAWLAATAARASDDPS